MGAINYSYPPWEKQITHTTHTTIMDPYNIELFLLNLGPRTAKAAAILDKTLSMEGARGREEWEAKGMGGVKGIDGGGKKQM